MTSVGLMVVWVVSNDCRMIILNVAGIGKECFAIVNATRL